MSQSNETSWVTVGCGCLLILIHWIGGYFGVHYLVETLFHKTIAPLWAALIAFFVGKLALIGAIVVWILKHAGIL